MARLLHLTFLLIRSFAQILIPLPLHAINTAPLQPISAQTYQLTISGTVKFEGEPCAGAEVVMQLRSPLNKEIKAAAKTKPDGRYKLTVSFKEFANDSIDWKMTAQRDSLRFEALEGRRILEEDSTSIEIEKTIEVEGSDNNIQLALR